MTDFKTPADLEPFQVLFDGSEQNPALPQGLVRFAGNLGFPAPPADRPWVYANFVQSMDGLVTFGGKRSGGEWISRSRHDRWMMDLLRAHADAVLYGAASLRQETLFGRLPGGPVFRITDPELLRLRQERLGRGKQKNIIVTGSGSLKVADYRLFRSQHVDALLATAPEGLQRLGDTGMTQVFVSGQGRAVDLQSLLRTLRREHGVRYLLCEGGPTLYGHMIRGGWVDEKFLTIAPQEVGPGIPPEQELTELEKQTGVATRLTSFAGTGFSPETARWYRWISCRKAGDHEFNRYRVLPLEARGEPRG